MELKLTQIASLWQLAIKADLAKEQVDHSPLAARKTAADYSTATQMIHDVLMQLNGFYRELERCVSEVQR